MNEIIIVYKTTKGNIPSKLNPSLNTSKQIVGITIVKKSRISAIKFSPKYKSQLNIEYVRMKTK